MPSETKNGTDTKGGRTSASGKDITLLEEFLVSINYPLNVCGNQDITGHSIYKIAQSCQKLRYLNIGFCGNITDDFIYKIVEACKLELLSCHNITDNSVNILLQLIHNLEYLELDQCGFITDSSICNIANFCPKLEHLDIGACDVSDTSICNIVRSCKKLKYLDIRCCRHITDKVIDGISQHCFNLEFLSMISTNVSKNALRKLNPKIKTKQDSTLDMGSEEELNDLRTSLVYLVQDLWLSYANLEDIVQYCDDKIKGEHYKRSIAELERDMRGMAERLGLMVSMYGLKEKINYQPTKPELGTNYAITNIFNSGFFTTYSEASVKTRNKKKIDKSPSNITDRAVSGIVKQVSANPDIF
ncbi:hypothetical protein Glove_186g147 [Diversispora epigaea]|uniref:F-box/LRR-repeat protein 15-like leucin rich repeat domain-containing protein n=1 Tax=Diversispora epigaea TaxID=1348612 RepID=A0A397IMA7_9GLOM|nr:hypothetical protein Glove_186g147 [Diversispora epigaea]